MFTLRVGNILPGERVSVELTVVGPLSYEDGEATFRFPLVVAPRYIPGVPLAGAAVGDGYADDTDAVPDASRITPPVLLPGFPNPVRLRDRGRDRPGRAAAGAPCASSLHAVSTARVTTSRSSRANGSTATSSCDWPTANRSRPRTRSTVTRRAADGEQGTSEAHRAAADRGRAGPPVATSVLLLDRSGSMGGWKMVAARRAAARIVDTLTTSTGSPCSPSTTASSAHRACRRWSGRGDRPPPLPRGRAPGPRRRPRRHRTARPADRRARPAGRQRRPRPGPGAGHRRPGRQRGPDPASGDRPARRHPGPHGRHRPRRSTPASSAGWPASAAAGASWSRARTGSTTRWTVSTAASARRSSPVSP